VLSRHCKRNNMIVASLAAVHTLMMTTAHGKSKREFADDIN